MPAQQIVFNDLYNFVMRKSRHTKRKSHLEIIFAHQSSFENKALIVFLHMKENIFPSHLSQNYTRNQAK